MSFEDYETLPTNNITSHMMAGAMAGIMEHCVMFPLDSVKTRMQSFSVQNESRTTIRHVLGDMVYKEGLLRPFRGVQVVFMGAGPAHALYFSVYEVLKQMISTKWNVNSTISSGTAGMIATLLHDGIMTPSDAVKQRLQMYNSPYRGVFDCIRQVVRTEGVSALYRSYTTQLSMNIPFQSIHFMVYEWSQTVINPSREYNPKAHMASGAVAGGFAAAVTTPLDVCKTLLNTQKDAKVKGLVNAVRTVYRLSGAKGFFRGLSPRVLYQMPSTAICWSTYEFWKWILIHPSSEESPTTEKKTRELPSLSQITVPVVALSDSAILEVTRS